MAYADLYRPDRLFLPQQKLAAFAGNVPTPFYIYHAEGIRKAAQLIRGSFCWAPEHRAWFPISANGCPQILRILREEGFGVLARSVRELELAQACGFSDIAFHTGAMTAEAARAAAKAGCTVIFDSPAQIEAMANCLPPRCLLRLCPEKDLGTNRAVAALKNRSGMDRTQILAAVQTLRSRGAEHIGLHCHLPGAPGDERHYPAVAAMLLELALEIYTRTGVRIDCIDPGGGIDVRSEPHRGIIQLSRVGALVRDVWETMLPPELRPAICTEFGRYAVARHGLLISRVVEIRERNRSFAILDASTAQLPDLLLGGVRHPISVVGTCARSGRRVYAVYGCTPNARERICDRAILPELRPGTLLAIHGAGAYCESVQIPRCMLPACGSYLYTADGEFVPTA